MSGFGGRDKGRGPLERYASFDYCYNYFQSFKDHNVIEELCNDDNIEDSCLQLSFYLASWGMYRGSAFVLQKSSKFYEQLIKNIIEFDRRIWTIDVDNYIIDNNMENIDLLIKCKEIIKESFDDWTNATDTLISKIMLGVFGNVPAFDNFFREGCRRESLQINSFCKNSLKNIYNFYYVKENKIKIDRHSNNIQTLDFVTGLDSNRTYTKAKIIDMIFFTEGNKKKLSIH
ncbi:MAG: hypothetical protein NTW30_05770 [Candidatus Aenigmarchaeota archaeon]|nr:hypothetical protein [Candidatus Aenigmarchaeota archaeon]